MSRKPAWAESRKHLLTPDFCDSFAKALEQGATVKQAALQHQVPPGVVKHWLQVGEEQKTRIYETPELGPEAMGPEGKLWDACAPALSKRNTRELKKVEDPKWKLERYDAEDFGPAASRVEVTGAHGAPIAVEGRTVVGLADVVALAIATGQGHLLGLDAGDARPALPPAPDVLPDPAGDQQAASTLPAA